MNVVNAVNLLRPHKWKLYESREAGLLPDGVLRRCVNDISHADMNELVAFCERFGDVSNFEVNPGIGWGFVRDPWVDGAPRDGVWRLLSTRVERMDARQVQGAPEGTRWRLVQELAEGWLETLRGDECRLVEGRRLSGDAAANAGGEKFYTLRWVGVSPDRVEALADELASVEELGEILYRRVGNDGLTVTEKLEGTWRHLASRGSLAEDGSGVVEWTVADPQYVLSGFASWFGSRQSERIRIWNVPEALAQGLIDAAKAQGKSAEGVSYDDNLGLVNLVIEVPNLDGVALGPVKVGENCDSTEYAQFLWGSGDKDLLPIPVSIPAGTSYRRDVSENGDGTWTLTLRWSVRKYRDIAEYDSAEDATDVTATKVWLGWTTENLGTALNTDVPGKRVAVDIQHREDCSKDVVRRVTDPKEVDTGWHEISHPEGNFFLRSVLNATNATRDAVKADLTTASGAGNVTVFSIEPTEFKDRWRIYARYQPQSTTWRITAINWEGFGEREVSYPAFSHPNGIVYRAFIVKARYTSSINTAYTFANAAAAEGYTKAPSYQGYHAGLPRNMGGNRWVAMRIEVSNT